MRQRGYTLAEVLAVVAIAGIAAALGAHGIAGSSRAQSTAALSRSLHFAMLRARAEALGDGTQRRLNCLAGGCRLEIAGARGMGAQGAWSDGGLAVTTGPSARICSVEPATLLGPSVPSTPLGSGSTIVFFPDGTASAATVFVADRNGGNPAKVYVFAATGMSRMGTGW
jgi:prepilin-type N-terminal cleavage/methylation domain-containing protein